jgi:hypothetical protein
MASLARALFPLLLAIATAHSSPARAQTEAAPAATQSQPAGAGAETVRYGFGVRLPRFVSVPSFLLGAFFTESVPLTTFGAYGVEFIRRKPGFDMVLGLAYQSMSPPDGNWLGRGKAAGVDTDLVQFRSFSLLAVDLAFVGRRSLNQYFGWRYGAGLGVGLVRGEMLRISNNGCTAENAGDERRCRPQFCPESGCTEAMLKASEGLDGGPNMPARYREPDVPGAVPIVNLSLGLDLHLPEVPGFEVRLEGGFYDAFFLGLGWSYIF